MRLLLATLLAVLAPGLEPYQAVAAISRPQADAKITQPLLGIPALPVHPSLGALSVAIPLAAGSALPPIHTPSVAAFQALETGSAHLAAATQPGQRAAVLNSLFEASRQGGGFTVLAAPSGGASGVPGLAPLASLEELKGQALKAKTDQERRAAVKAIADRSDEPALLALEEIGNEAGPTAADYEIKRLALRHLWEKGRQRSLPPISQEHKQEIIAKLGAEKPQAAAFDYDDTLEKNGDVASAETGQALKTLADSGVETLILTNRPDQQMPSLNTAVARLTAGPKGVLELVAGLPAEQKASFSVASSRGARLFVFDRQGQARSLHRAQSWTEAELEALDAAARAVATAIGAAPGQTETRHADYEFVVGLPNDIQPEAADKALSAMRQSLSRLASSLSVRLWRSSTAGARLHVVALKYDKSYGASRLLRLREHLGRLRDVERLLPSWLHGAGRRLVGLLPKGRVAGSSALLVGDSFMGEANGIDGDMIEGAPGAMAIAVGGKADPRHDRVFVWPSQGHEASMEIARAASGPAPSQMPGLNKKAAFGLFGARSISIVAFLMTTLAYNQLARNAVGDIKYGMIMALGTLGAVAAGPLMGKIADKFSPKSGMAINVLLRVFFLLDMPLFYAFGILNFWTLLLGAIANGWLLSSIMTSESAYLRKIFGFQSLVAVNSLLQLNYFFLQMALGLMLGIGSLVAAHSLIMPFYVASAINLFVILPILWKTIPGRQEAGMPPAVKGPSLLKTIGPATAAFFKKFWREALLFAATVAIPPVLLAFFPALPSALIPIPIVLSLLFWVLRTSGFAVIKEKKPLLGAATLVSLGALIFYGVQYFLLSTLAPKGVPESALINGQLLGALFLGQMISSTSLAKLPIVRLPFIGRFGLQRVIQVLVVGLVGAWVFTGLFPGSLLMTAIAVAVTTLMMALSNLPTDKGWLSLFAVSSLFLLLPAFLFPAGLPLLAAVTQSFPLLLASFLMFGFFFGPASSVLWGYLGRESPKDKVGMVMGIQGSLFNAAISLGIGLLAFGSTQVWPMYPGTLWIAGALSVAISLAYIIISRRLPGLAPRMFQARRQS